MNSPHILVVEDEPALANALRDKFEREGFSVSIALNGEEGLRMACDQKPDLILLDIVMPVMDGLTMLTELRKDPWGKDARVIMLTNLSDAIRVSDAVEHGVHDYLVKTDWKLEDLVAKARARIGASA